MWLLIFLRLIMPVQLHTPFSISNLIPDHMQMLTSYQDNQSLMDSSPGAKSWMTDDTSPPIQAPNTQAVGQLFNLQFILRVTAYVWIIGWAILILTFLVLTMRFRDKLTASKVLDSEILELAEQCCIKLHIKRKIPLFTNSLIRSPGILGVIHPAIYLPEDIQTQVNPEQLQHIILHELAHYKRRDLLCNLFSLLAAAIHWFNPLVWIALKEMRQDREVACDTYVMEVLGEPHTITYGKTILDLARSFSRVHRQATLISFNETSGQVERRIKMIKRFETGSYKLSAIAIIVCLVVGAVILTDAVSQKPSLNTMANVASNEKIKDKLVLIDPGHGGEDFGGTYPVDASDSSLVQVKEKDLNLDIALKLYEMLQKSGIKVEMTRMDDRTLSLDERVNMAKADNAVLVLSIHNNMSNKETSNGTSTSFYAANDQQNPAFNNARFAELLQKELIKQLQTSDLGVKAANFRIIKDTGAFSAQVDVAYISNEQDRNNLLDEGFRAKAIQALYDGIIESLNEIASEQ
jgi:N-acetylmuramoyl-L-alanine amidase